MKNMYKLLLVFLLVPLASTASDTKGKYTKTKSFNKEFTVDDNNTVKIYNKYGNVDVVTWNENRVVIDVQVSVNGNDESKVEKRLEQIDVQFNQSSDMVSAKTIIEKSSNSWNLWGKKNKLRLEINYTVKMPAVNNADLNNNYGAISLDKLSGKAKIDCDYGKIHIGDLSNDENSIVLDYSKNSSIEYMKNGSIDADYSGLHVEEAGNVKLNADYSHLTFGKLGTVDMNCDYGTVKIGSSGDVKLNSDYTHTTLENLNGSANLSMDYGSFKVANLSADFGTVTANCSYSHLKFGVAASSSFNFKAALSYASFKGKDDFNFTKQEKKGKSASYEGSYNGTNASNSMALKMSYGSLSVIKK